MLFVAIVAKTLQLLSWICIADALLSWFQGPDQVPRKFTQVVTEPLYAPIQRFARPVFGGIDWTPLLVIFALNGLARLLYSAAG